MNLLQRDAGVCWHPFTQAATAPQPLPVVAAEGAWLVLDDGRRIFDGLCSWWSILHGHGEPRIVAAIAEQAAQLDHVLFAGCTHPPAVELSEALIARAPRGLERVFFSDDGSTAVEVALKMAFQYHHNRGDDARRHFICLEGGYHGDTIGAMSAGDPQTFGEPFEPLLFPVTRIAPPFDRGALDNHETPSLDPALADLDRAFEEHRGAVAAVVVEPMVQGAAGMRMMPSRYLRALRDRCDAHGALLIADEVMTGFGRTGTMFAVEHAGVTPDMLCVSKALTGGVLPLAATLTPQRIYDAFLDKDMRRGFLHGHTFTANPIACAAANASLAIPGALERVRALESFYAQRLPRFAARPMVREVRFRGMIGVVEVAGGPDGYYNPVGAKIQSAMLARGYLVRPLGAVVYLMPPLCTTDDELAELFDHLEDVLDAL